MTLNVSSPCYGQTLLFIEEKVAPMPILNKVVKFHI